MARPDPDQLGARVGPRLAELLTRSYVTVKRQMHDETHRVGVHVGQTLIDAAGLELAELMQPLLRPVLDRGKIPPHIAALLEQIISGRDQWKAIAGMAFGMSGAASALSEIVSNYLGPLVYDAVSLDPLLIPDIATVVQAGIRGFISQDDSINYAGQLGYSEPWWVAMAYLSAFYPDPATLIEMYNREVIDKTTLQNYLQYNGIAQIQWPWWEALARDYLSPADAALAVLRGNMTADDGAKVAKISGMTADDFDVLIGNTGEPPGLMQMIELYRRKQIDLDTLKRAVLQSRVRDEWFDDVVKLAVVPPTGQQAVAAFVQGQMDEATAKSWYEQAGGDPDYWEIDWHTAAGSPTPIQLGTLAYRGLIPWDGLGPDVTSYAQGFKEGAWKDKWLKPMQGLSVYLPPPREIITLAKDAAIDETDALRMLKEHGMSDDLARIYWEAATSGKVLEIKKLAEAQVIKLYSWQAIDKDKATEMLGLLGYNATNSDFILAVADMTRYERMLNSAITKVQTMFLAGKLTEQQAATALATYEVPSGQALQLLALWKDELATQVKTLSPSQVTDAVYYEIMTFEQATDYLVNLGYSDADAWALISIRMHGPQPNPPYPYGQVTNAAQPPSAAGSPGAQGTG